MNDDQCPPMFIVYLSRPRFLYYYGGGGDGGMCMCVCVFVFGKRTKFKLYRK